MKKLYPAALLLVSGVAFAQQDAPSLDRMFPREADVTAGSGDQLSRLELPPEVLAVVKPDLSDLRLFDGAGNEVPYFVDSGLPRSGVSVEQSIPAVPKDVARTHTGAYSFSEEHFQLALPKVAPEGGRWVLTFRTSRPEFVKALTIEGKDHAGLVHDASIFRLGPGREKLRVLLPAGAPETIVVSLAGQGDFLNPEMAFESSRNIEERDEARVPLALFSRSQPEHGITELQLARPVGLVPDELVFESDTPAFDRPVQVWDEGGAARGESAIGKGAIYRVNGAAVAQDLVVAIGPAMGDRLRVRITDGDSPGLSGLKVSAVVRRPALIFALKGSGVLRFGGGRAWRPVYDLAGLAGQWDLITRTWEPAALPAARLSAARDNPRFLSQPTLAFAMHPAAEVDRKTWKKIRSLELSPSPDGLSRVALGAGDVSLARADLGDVRVIDDSSHQWPYLLAKDPAGAWNDAEVHSVVKEKASHFAIPIPATPLVCDEVRLVVDAPFFDRAFRLVAKPVPDPSADSRDAPEDLLLASGRLTRRVGDPRSPSISFPSQRVASLELVVEDGDDAPLPIRSAGVRSAAPELYLVAPAGKYQLLIGNAEAEPAHYELAAVRDVVLAVPSAAAAQGPLQDNPLFSRTAKIASGGSATDTAVLWGVMLVAIVGLGALTLKLARGAPEAKSGEPKA